MTNSEVNRAIMSLLRQNKLPPLPSYVIDRDGRRMEMSGTYWKFNVPTFHAAFDWARQSDGSIIVGYALRRWASMLMTQQAGWSVLNALTTVLGALRGRSSDNGTQARLLLEQWQALASTAEADDLKGALRRHVEAAVRALRTGKAMDEFYLLRSWYRWSATMLPCLGFDEQFALELDEVPVPTRSSLLAVEMEDEERGPLWDTEVTVLRAALASDRSQERSHVMQRAAVALSLAYGRNPSNYCLLREEDLSNQLAAFDVPPQWILAIPRIKKWGIGARQQFVEERVSNELLQLMRDLLAANASIDCKGYPRPLFMRASADAWRAGTGIEEYAHHMTGKEFLSLIRAFATRMAIVSPRTGRLLRLSSRRLRYTFATTMVELGASKTVLATMLDHSDTQHVRVYYALKGERLTRIMDRAAALRLGPLMKLFKGAPIGADSEVAKEVSQEKRVRFVGDTEAVDPVEIGACGQSPRCLLDPPFSCYVCPKFQPYLEADHQAVLDALLKGREDRRGRLGTRLSVQMDEVIYAVAEVVQLVAHHGKRNGGQA
ncbi:tyrosine-type recombinase/integrase [Cupriavidus sp. Agwp_2]|uniref:tyrosine-type recombinase/integrase n=1 Tax=Cupriavidus sp. Agwp_2 TaxID=2897324 RepID=UPI003460629A